MAYRPPPPMAPGGRGPPPLPNSGMGGSFGAPPPLPNSYSGYPPSSLSSQAASFDDQSAYNNPAPAPSPAPAPAAPRRLAGAVALPIFGGLKAPAPAADRPQSMDFVDKPNPFKEQAARLAQEQAANNSSNYSDFNNSGNNNYSGGYDSGYSGGPSQGQLPPSQSQPQPPSFGGRAPPPMNNPEQGNFGYQQQNYPPQQQPNQGGNYGSGAPANPPFGAKPPPPPHGSGNWAPPPKPAGHTRSHTAFASPSYNQPPPASEEPAASPGFGRGKPPPPPPSAGAAPTHVSRSSYGGNGILSSAFAAPPAQPPSQPQPPPQLQPVQPQPQYGGGLNKPPPPKFAPPPFAAPMVDPVSQEAAALCSQLFGKLRQFDPNHPMLELLFEHLSSASELLNNWNQRALPGPAIQNLDLRSLRLRVGLESFIESQPVLVEGQLQKYGNKGWSQFRPSRIHFNTLFIAKKSGYKQFDLRNLLQIDIGEYCEFLITLKRQQNEQDEDDEEDGTGANRSFKFKAPSDVERMRWLQVLNQIASANQQANFQYSLPVAQRIDMK